MSYTFRHLFTMLLQYSTVQCYGTVSNAT